MDVLVLPRLKLFIIIYFNLTVDQLTVIIYILSTCIVRYL